MPLRHRPGRHIGVHGQKHVIFNMAGSKEQIMILACVSANGQYIPLMVIFKRKGLTEELVFSSIHE